MIYIGISLLIGIISIGIAFYVRYKIEEDKFIKRLELEQTQKIWKKNEEFQTELKHYEDLYNDTLKTKDEEFQASLKYYEDLYNDTLRRKKTEIIDLIQKYDNEEMRLKNEHMSKTIVHNQKINEITAKYKDAEHQLKLMEERKQHTDEVLNNYYENEKLRIEDKIQNITTACVEEMMKQVGEKSIECEEQIKKFQDVLLSYQQRQAAVNEAIMRERQLQEQSEFYTINLSQPEIDDLLMIKELSPRFNNRELLNKIVYESYIKRPLQEMIKRVLSGHSPSGIYKITRKSTGEVYIGRAVAVDKRWTEHVKMAFSIGSIAHSTLHTIMEKEGVWNFTFELLEEVPKEQLNEREKYYIDFYDSKNFGMNQRNGG